MNLRVLVIAPTPFFSDRGCHVRIYEQIKYVSSRGCDVRLVSYPLGNDPPGLLVDRVGKLFHYTRAEAGPAWPRLILDAQVLLRSISIFREFKPHLIHAHLHEGAAVSFILKTLFRIPVLFDYQGSLTEESLQHGFIREEGFSERAFRYIEELIDRSADQVVTSSGGMAAGLAASGVACETLPDGVDLEVFKPGAAPFDLLEGLSLPADAKRVVYLGVMSDYQGVDILLKAARSMRDAGDNVRFILMGYPEDEYRKLALQMGLADTVRFTGRVDYFRAPEYLRLGNAAVAPKLAKTESNGKVLNYIACGLPTVAFDLPVNRELLGDAARYVELSDDRDTCAERFAEAVREVLASEEITSGLRAASLARAREMSLDKQGERLLSIYRTMLEKRHGR